ncbi:hypothetical protein GIB67_011141 [Kingdonia uniflora]|uniref:Uncharacterized protein n=1 Tax=Kingdonia uniflora TaxID=39325 RepID=A0A7J7PAQ3_9MAGN|nr:hypothetical protein GIB67_011141 [Kingdonia uniflora]
MSNGRQTVRDLVEEAKKRVVLLTICVVGLSYLMSLTSSSVWVNLPAAASLILFVRYISLDFDMRRRAAAYNKKPPPTNHTSKKSLGGSTVIASNKPSWRKKVNSPIVEAAIDQFTKRLVSEFVTDLWYSRLTPDKDGPEELVQIINGVLGELSCRGREINLIDFLTRDIIDLFCTDLELYRACQAKIEKKQLGSISIDQRDAELKLVLVAENKLHPALFSAEAEHRVLQHLMNGLISFTFEPEDLQCSFFRYTVRELLSCAVMRPVLNLVSPRFINEKIESLVLSRGNKAEKGVTPSAHEASKDKQNGASSTPSDFFPGFIDHSITGVELVQFKHDKPRINSGKSVKENVNVENDRKDPLLSVDPRSSRSWSSLPSDSRTVGEWGQMLDMISHRKTQALAPENFENMWAKGRNYNKKEGTNQAKQDTLNLVGSQSKVSSKNDLKIGSTADNNSLLPRYNDRSKAENIKNENEHDYMHLENSKSESDSSCAENEENSSITGFDSPGTKVWDSKNNKSAAVSYIRHPLESSDGHITRKTGLLANKMEKGHPHHRSMKRTQSGRKRSRLNSKKTHVWQEVQRTSFSLEDGIDILKTLKDVKSDESSDDPELESWGRAHSGEGASSSAPSRSASEVCSSYINSPENGVSTDSYLKLRCEVLGANIVKSGSKTFAVYSISVTDADNNIWSIKRRFRHFEELHQRLKEFPNYNLRLPSKHFLSSGLELAVVQERSKLLDNYLKKLLQLPTISGSIEVWDFLSVDSQTYTFSNSLSIIQTLPVDLDHKSHQKNTKVQSMGSCVKSPLSPIEEQSISKSKQDVLQMKHDYVADNSRFEKMKEVDSSIKSPGTDYDKSLEDQRSHLYSRTQRSGFDAREPENHSTQKGSDGPEHPSESLHGAVMDSTISIEWVPPNLSIPILDLVDVIFQLQDGGWIRRQAFWVAKQVLQLGMGDAFDDWLIAKIQSLGRGSIIASAINRLEQILWPDGIFLTKHPKRQRPPQSVNPAQSSPHGGKPTQLSSPQKANGSVVDEQQKEEAARRAKFVYELMIDNAPAALVGLVGRKEYERSAKDLYFFLQSQLCLKQLAFNLLELLLLSAFPDLDDVVKQMHEDKQKFGHMEVM